MKAHRSDLRSASVTLLPTAAAAPIKQRRLRKLPGPVVDARQRFLERVRSQLDDRRGVQLPKDPAPVQPTDVLAQIRRVEMFLQFAREGMMEVFG